VKLARNRPLHSRLHGKNMTMEKQEAELKQRAQQLKDSCEILQKEEKSLRQTAENINRDNKTKMAAIETRENKLHSSRRDPERLEGALQKRLDEIDCDEVSIRDKVNRVNEQCDLKRSELKAQEKGLEWDREALLEDKKKFREEGIQELNDREERLQVYHDNLVAWADKLARREEALAERKAFFNEIQNRINSHDAPYDLATARYACRFDGSRNTQPYQFTVPESPRSEDEESDTEDTIHALLTEVASTHREANSPQASEELQHPWNAACLPEFHRLKEVNTAVEEPLHPWNASCLPDFPNMTDVEQDPVQQLPLPEDYRYQLQQLRYEVDLSDLSEDLSQFSASWEREIRLGVAGSGTAPPLTLGAYFHNISHMTGSEDQWQSPLDPQQLQRQYGSELAALQDDFRKLTKNWKSELGIGLDGHGIPHRRPSIVSNFMIVSQAQC
jgi:hypothetical protein